MSLSGIESTFQTQCDHLAAVAKDYSLGLTDRQNLWAMVDATADETYENCVKGSLLSQIDAVMDDPGAYVLPAAVGNWTQLHHMYFQQQDDDADVVSFDTALDGFGWRVSAFMAQYSGVYVSPANIFPKEDLDAGYLEVDSTPDTSPTWNADSDWTNLDSDVVGMAVFTATPNSALGSEWKVTFKMLQADGSTEVSVIELTFAAAATAGQVIGRTTLDDTSSNSGGKTTLPLTSTTGFVVGERVLIRDSADETQQEVRTIDSVSAGVSITLTAETVREYQSGDYCTPLFSGVASSGHAADAGSKGTAGDKLNVETESDRTLSYTS